MTEFSDALLSWFRENRRDLPWRSEPRDPYAVWVSEIMLQQTQVKTVIPYFDRWISRFPDIGSLAQATLDDVLTIWQGLGYYRRARMLHEAATEITELPSDYAGWRNVRGVGDYTAAAIASLCYAEAVPAIDGNVIRVVARISKIEEVVDRAVGKKRVQNEATALLDTERPGEFNEAMMELGATICTPKKPSCSRCPVEAFCLGRDIAEQLPLKTPKKSPEKWNPHLIVPSANGALRVEKGDEALLGGLWGFATYESEQALRKQWRDAQHIGVVKHLFSHRDTTYEVYLSEVERFPSDGEWIDPAEPHAPMSTAMKKVVALFRAHDPTRT